MTLAAQATLLAAEEEREGLDLVLPDLAELLWGALAFLVVLVALTRFAFPRIRAAVEARERKIQSDLEEAEKARNEARASLDEYKQQLAEARSEANRIIEEARGQAEQVRHDITERAERESQAIVERAQEQIEAERRRTVQELHGEIAELSIELAEKVVGRSLDGGTQRELVDAYIREVSGMGTSNGGGRG